MRLSAWPKRREVDPIGNLDALPTSLRINNERPLAVSVTYPRGDEQVTKHYTFADTHRAEFFAHMATDHWGLTIQRRQAMRAGGWMEVDEFVTRP